MKIPYATATVLSRTRLTRVGTFIKKIIGTLRFMKTLSPPGFGAVSVFVFASRIVEKEVRLLAKSSRRLRTDS